MAHGKWGAQAFLRLCRTSTQPRSRSFARDPNRATAQCFGWGPTPPPPGALHHGGPVDIHRGGRVVGVGKFRTARRSCADRSSSAMGRGAPPDQLTTSDTKRKGRGQMDQSPKDTRAQGRGYTRERNEDGSTPNMCKQGWYPKSNRLFAWPTRRFPRHAQTTRHFPRHARPINNFLRSAVLVVPPDSSLCSSRLPLAALVVDCEWD